MGKKYFTGLNYTLGNEDTTVEIELAHHYRPRGVFSVCGSGGRALPFCSDFTQLLTLADLSEEQILLAKLREATYRQLSYQDFLTFWGYYPYADDNFCETRKKLFFEMNLPSDVLVFFTNVFKETHFHSVLYLGKWERTFKVLAQITRTIMGRDFDAILRIDDLNTQIKFLEEHFPHKRWKTVIFLLGNKTLFNAILYKGSFIEKNISDSHFTFYQKAFDRLFRNGIAQKSFFLQLCFYGKIQSLEGIPIEAQEKTHQRIGKSSTQVNYLVEDMLTHLSRGEKKYDFLSLSDVPSYFKGEVEKNFMQMIKASLNPNAIVVNRYYLRVPACNLDNFVDVTDLHRDLIKNELVQMYDIRVYKYTSI